MRDSKTFALLLFFLSSIPLFLLLRPGFFQTHDGEAHVARFAAYFKAFADGQVIPRWASDLNAGYGSPLFIFFYPLPGYVASFLHMFGLEFETIFKIILFASFVLAPFFLYQWLKTFARDEVAFIGALIYMMLPYRILDTYVRGDIGELLSFVFIPLVFIFIDRIRKEKKSLSIVTGACAYCLLILAHNGIAVIFSPVFISYSIVFSKKRKDFLLSFVMIFLGLLLSSFFWLPAILEGKFVYAKLFIEEIYKVNFIPAWHLFYSSWGFGPRVNVNGGQSPQIGIFYVLIPILSLIFFSKIKQRKELFFWLIVFFSTAFMTTRYSQPVWEKMPVIKLMGYPWRFTSLSGFASCIIIFFTLKNIKKRIILYLLLTLFFVTSLPFVKVYEYTGKNDNYYLLYQGTTDYHNRTTPIWTEGNFWEKAKSQFEIIAGKGTLKNITRRSIKQTVDVEAKSNIQILDNTVYFPGWKVLVDDEKVPIGFQDANHRGLITFYVQKGRHHIIVLFGESPIRMIADLISLFSFISIFLLFFFRKRIDKVIAKV